MNPREPPKPPGSRSRAVTRRPQVRPRASGGSESSWRSRPVAGKITKEPRDAKTYSVAEAIYGSTRLALPFEGLLLIGY